MMHLLDTIYNIRMKNRYIVCWPSEDISDDDLTKKNGRERSKCRN